MLRSLVLAFVFLILAPAKAHELSLADFRYMKHLTSDQLASAALGWRQETFLDSEEQASFIDLNLRKLTSFDDTYIVWTPLPGFGYKVEDNENELTVVEWFPRAELDRNNQLLISPTFRSIKIQEIKPNKWAWLTRVEYSFLAPLFRDQRWAWRGAAATGTRSFVTDKMNFNFLLKASISNVLFKNLFEDVKENHSDSVNAVGLASELEFLIGRNHILDVSGEIMHVEPVTDFQYATEVALKYIW